jgi:hypothetical protein
VVVARRLRRRGKREFELVEILVDPPGAAVEITHDRRHGRAVQHDRDQHRQAHGAPEQVRLLEGAVAEAVGEVVERAESANAVHGDDRLFALRPIHADEAEPGPERTDDEKRDQREAHGFPGQAAQEPAIGQGAAEEDQQRHHQDAFELLGEVVQLLVVGVPSLALRAATNTARKP